MPIQEACDAVMWSVSFGFWTWFSPTNDEITIVGKPSNKPLFNETKLFANAANVWNLKSLAILSKFWNCLNLLAANNDDIFESLRTQCVYFHCHLSRQCPFSPLSNANTISILMEICFSFILLSTKSRFKLRILSN